MMTVKHTRWISEEAVKYCYDGKEDGSVSSAIWVEFSGKGVRTLHRASMQTYNPASEKSAEKRQKVKKLMGDISKKMDEWDHQLKLKKELLQLTEDTANLPSVALWETEIFHELSKEAKLSGISLYHTGKNLLEGTIDAQFNESLHKRKTATNVTTNANPPSNQTIQYRPLAPKSETNDCQM